MGWIKKIKIPELPAFIKSGKKMRPDTPHSGEQHLHVPRHTAAGKAHRGAVRKSGKIRDFFERAFGKKKPAESPTNQYADPRVVNAFLRGINDYKQKPSPSAIKKLNEKLRNAERVKNRRGMPWHAPTKPKTRRIPPFGGKKKAVTVTPDGQKITVTISEQKNPPQAKEKIKKPDRMASEGKPKDGFGDYYEDPKLERQFDYALQIKDFGTMATIAHKAFVNKYYFQAAMFYHFSLFKVLNALEPNTKIFLPNGETLARWLLSDGIDCLKIICKRLPHDATVANSLNELLRARKSWDTGKAAPAPKLSASNAPSMPPGAPGSPGTPEALDVDFWNKLRGSHKEFFPQKPKGE